VQAKKQELLRKRQEFRKFRDKQSPKIESKKRELARAKEELRVSTRPEEQNELKQRKKKLQQELSRLKSEFRAAKDATEGVPGGRAAPRAEDGSESGALPDFAIIGVKKGGTTFLYHLLSQHPYVEPASVKEPHFFDNLFDEGIEWYRRCFPAPKWKDGRRTITGEASPYMPGRRVPERVAKVVPQARLIALLRNPVDRAYSDYQQVTWRGRETRTFEEAISVRKQRSLSQEDETSERCDRISLDERSEYLSRGIYVDQLLRWSEFFSEEQMLILKSEEFFERPKDTLKAVLDFLDLPEWEPQALEPRDEPNKEKYERTKVNKGRYEQEMDPATRRRLEEYFEAHNRRLYDYLGVDFGW